MTTSITKKSLAEHNRFSEEVTKRKIDTSDDEIHSASKINHKDFSKSLIQQPERMQSLVKVTSNEKHANEMMQQTTNHSKMLHVQRSQNDILIEDIASNLNQDTYMTSFNHAKAPIIAA